MADPGDRSPTADAPPGRDNSAFAFDRTHGSESIPERLRELVQQGSHIAEEQTKFVQAEVRSAAGELTGAVGAMAGAGVVAIAGLGVLLMGLSWRKPYRFGQQR